MSQCNPSSHGILKELGKLAELKQRGLILDRHFETIKAHVKAGNSVAKERWDAIESAWGLKQNGVFDEEEWVTQIDGETQGITGSTRLSSSSQEDVGSARGTAPPSQHPPAAAGTARRKAVDRGKQVRERAAKGTLGGKLCNAFAIGSRGPIERTRGGVKDFISGIIFQPPTPESRRSCPHCPMTFVNEQGHGIHVRTQHSSANMSNGVRLRRMLRKDVEGSVLPWEAAGPGRCWHVKFDHATGTASFKAHAVNQLRILQGNAEDLWKEERRTPLQFLEDRLKIPYSNIVKWAKNEKKLIAAAADDAKKSLLAKQQPKRWFPEAEKRLYKEFVERLKLKVSTLRRTNLKNKSVEERLPKIQRSHRLFRKLLQEPVRYRAPDESDASAVTTVAESECRVPKYGQFQLWERCNVDQVSLAFVNGLLDTWDKRGALRVAISQPFPGLEKRQCTMQVIFGPGDKTICISVIFRGTGKRISPVEKAAYHEDVDVFPGERVGRPQVLHGLGEAVLPRRPHARAG
ncbi:unnamed protein product [Ectocarpus sp. CCAP 1310/34]|nr:unnamed protein product [Ectocarpus sp. CCAP 1310/34]